MTKILSSHTIRKNLRRLFLLFFIAVILAFAIYLLRKARPASAAWFDDNWAYRQTVAITNSSGSTQTDYQVQITLATNSLYTAGKIQSDCDDIRITDPGGNLLNYWLEPGTCNTASTLIWTKVSSIPTSGTYVYVYYGNPSAASQSSVANTFIRDISGVQGAWKLNESSGNASDSSGNSNTLTNNNSTSFTTGKFDNAASFTRSSSQYFSIADASQTGLDISTNITITAWINATDLSQWLGMPIISKGNNNSQYDNNYSFDFSDAASDTLGFFYRDTGGSAHQYNSNSVSVYGSWHFVAMTYTGGTGSSLTMYLDGSSISGSWTSGDGNGSLQTNSEDFKLGGYFNGDYFNGLIDEARIYSAILTSNEISDLYNNYGYVTTNYANHELVRKRVAGTTDPVSAGSPGSEEKSPGPLAWWKFDEGTGTTPQDSTVKNNDGAFSGSPTWQTEDLCVSGKCLYFPGGSSGSVTVSNTVANVQSVSFWAKSATASAALLDTGAGYIWATNGTLSAPGFTSPTIYVNGIASAAFTANQWQHIEVTTGTAISASAVKIASASNNYLQGFMDEVKFYSYARSADQVKMDYNVGRDKSRQAAPKGAGTVLGGVNPDIVGPWPGNLVGYWKMDESSGNAADSSGNSLTLTNNSSTAYGSGKFGNGMTCDGTADYFNTATAINGVKTVSFYVYPAAAANNYFVNLINSSTYITINSSGAVSATGFTSPSIYVNGVLNGTVSAAAWSLITVVSDTAVNANAFAVGLTNDGSNHFCTNTSKIDEVRLYNRAFTPSEVEGLYNFAPGPAGYWKMEEGSGTGANDSSGNANTGTVTAGIGGWTAGKFGKAYNFDNADTVVNAGSGSTLDNLPASGMSLEAWIYPTGMGENSAGVIIAKNVGTTPSAGWLFQFAGTNALTFTVDGSTDLVRTTSNSSVALNTWNHVVAAWDGVITTASSVHIYVNGVETTYATTTNGASRVDDGTSTLYLGNDSTSARTFSGKIDDVRIYNYARTQKQIVSDMNAGHPAVGSPVGSSLIYLKLDEGYGTAANNSGTLGSSGNGTLNDGAAWSQNGKFGKGVSLSGSSGSNVSITDFGY